MILFWQQQWIKCSHSNKHAHFCKLFLHFLGLQISNGGKKKLYWLEDTLDFKWLTSGPFSCIIVIQKHCGSASMLLLHTLSSHSTLSYSLLVMCEWINFGTGTFKKNAAQWMLCGYYMHWSKKKKRKELTAQGTNTDSTKTTVKESSRNSEVSATWAHYLLVFHIHL